MQSNESFLPGQYSYPFTFSVPAGIPGSYVHASGGYSDRAECTCTYTLYAEICFTNSPVGLDGMIGRSMCPIVIMQQARTPYNYNMIADMSSNVTTWCCCSRGPANIKCVFEKDVVRIDESVIMRFSADLSSCKNGLSSISCVLKRKLFLRLRNGFQCYRETNMISMEVPGIQAGEKMEEDKIVQFDLNKAYDIGTPENLVGALGEFGGKIQQTCNGQLIIVSYELHVIGKVDGCVCCAPSPYVFAPIEILAPEKNIMFQPIEYAMHSEVPTNPYAQPLPPKDPNEIGAGEMI